MLKVAIVGTRGVLCRSGSGGYEALVENIIGHKLADNIEYTVFCSAADMPTKPMSYNYRCRQS